MNRDLQITGLCRLSVYIKNFLQKDPADFDADDQQFQSVLLKSETENPCFTPENQRFALNQWANLLTQEKLGNWLAAYSVAKQPKRVGLILAGNIPMVGFHDVISVVLSNHIPVIKLSSKDRLLLPFLLEKWNEFSNGTVNYEFAERLENFDAVIATGSNNTARYFQVFRSWM